MATLRQVLEQTGVATTQINPNQLALHEAVRNANLVGERMREALEAFSNSPLVQTINEFIENFQSSPVAKAIEQFNREYNNYARVLANSRFPEIIRQYQQLVENRICNHSWPSHHEYETWSKLICEAEDFDETGCHPERTKDSSEQLNLVVLKNFPSKFHKSIVAYPRPQDLFELLISRGINQIDQWTDKRPPETFILDFKRKQVPNQFTLGENDQKNLGKALSGFANCGGGLLIWGLGAGKTETVLERHPILNISQFASEYETWISRLVKPFVLGVESFQILESQNSGYLVTLIPQSPSCPHWSIKTEAYHVRVGDSFNKADHDWIMSAYEKKFLTKPST